MNPTLQTLFSQRTVHGNFSDHPVKSEDLQTILAAAVRAPNASNRQSYAILTLHDPVTIQSICGYKGQTALLFCVDFTRIVALAKHLGHTYDPGNLRNFITGCTDTILAAQSAAIAARSLNIDTMFTNGVHRTNFEKTYELLNLPRQHCFPLILLILGYPRVEPSFLRGRLNNLGVVHSGTYQPLSAADLDQLVETYDDPQGHLEMSGVWRSEGYDHYLDWFYQVWCKGDGKKPDQVHTAVVQAGFIPDVP